MRISMRFYLKEDLNKAEDDYINDEKMERA